MKHLFLFIVIIFLIVSCDVITSTNGSFYFIDDTLTTTPQDTILVQKKILIINFTGIRCPNCPKSHQQIEQIQSVYPNRIVDVSIHGTALAIPNSNYKLDLRTPEGNALISAFGITQIPIGIIDFFDKNYLSNYNEWSNIVVNFINEPPKIYFKIDIIPTGDSTFNITVQVKKKDEQAIPSKIFVFITEDDLISRQAFDEPPGYIEPYTHKNVFRTSLTDIFGNIFEDNNLFYNLKIKPIWNVNKLKVVVFVVDNTNKVMNVEQIKLKKEVN